ncbi:aluminum induced protein with YGL and LRDR motifs [Rhynchospora pubera]|uniref:Aluminum induced protein with YGL and LRDR motifs n=1 Tax=Rhynchospora pubera TaxID=906938 RepID=A0AAV8GQI1_9POAL|nr:aluminum induced protein with YGL and LRDR motifs [Rhynchospora pubera]
MLGIFHKHLAHPPQELNSPEPANIPTGKHVPAVKRQPKNPDEIIRDFHTAYPNDSFAATFGCGAALACVGPHGRHLCKHERMFCGFENIYCMFVGRLDNLSSLIRQYGLSGKATNEAVLIIEAYRTLRDRGPYPADQVIKDLSGSFGFVVFDSTPNKTSVFAALSSDGEIPLFWGISGDGSVVICDDRDIVKAGCGKSYAPFPPGCMFHSEGGLKSFEHPMNKLKPMPRVDSEGMMCGANFKVDTFTKINSMPRVGSATNWASSWDL